MSDKHLYSKDFSLQEHFLEQKRIHKLYLEEQRRQGKIIPEFLMEDSEEDEDSDFDDSDEYCFRLTIATGMCQALSFLNVVANQ